MNEQEKIIQALSTHWIKYVAPTFMFSVVLFAAIAMLASAEIFSMLEEQLSGSIVIFIGVVLLYIAHHWFFHKLLSEAMEDIIITDKRVIWMKELLFCCNEMRQIQLQNIQGVESRKRGLSQTILGYGTVWFDTGGTETSDENARMDMVPHPNRIARQINQLRELS